MEIEAVAIKVLAGFIIAALVLASSALAGIEWCESPASARLFSCKANRSRETLRVVVPRPIRPADRIEGLGPRLSEVAVLRQHECLAKD